MPARPAVRRRPGAGYSLAEVVISLSVFIAILVGVLFIFNLNYRLARDRGDAAERQEALRRARAEVVRLARTAGGGALPPELAIEVARDVAPGSRVGGAGSPRVVAGTDVLTVRGVFSTPLLRVGPADGSLRLGGAGAAAAGAVEIHDPSPQTGVAQNLAELAAVLTARGPRTASLLLVSQLDESAFAVVVGDLARARVAWDGGRAARIDLPFDGAVAPPRLAGAGPAAALRGAAFVGLLEEYRFFVREAFSAPGDQTSTPRPQLSVARFVPGTDLPWGGGEGEPPVDLADNVVDLEVELAVNAAGELEVAVEIESGG